MINSFNTKGINYIESTSSIYTSFNFDLIIWEYIFLIAAASMHGVFFFWMCSLVSVVCAFAHIANGRWSSNASN